MANYITTYGGDGYFDIGQTKVNSNITFKFKATPRIAAEGFWFGFWGSYSQSYGIYHPVQAAENHLLKWYSTGGEGVIYQGSSIADILDHSFEIEMNTTSVKVNGTTVSRNAPIDKTYSAFNIGNARDASRYDGKQPVDWEYFKIYSGDTLIKDLVPAYKNNQYCFKDEVSGNYLFSTGTVSGNVRTFGAEPDFIQASYEASSSTITLEAETGMSWTATSIPSWITLSSSAGTGTATITVSVAENNDYSPRTGTIVFSNGEDTAEVECTQAKHPLLVPFNNIYRNGLIN